MPATTIHDERTFDADRFVAKEIFRTARSKTVCGYFKPGHFIPVHAPESDVTVVVLEGAGIVRDGSVDHEVAPGAVVAVPAGTERGIRAGEEGLEAVLVTAPPPTDGEHEPVRLGLQRDEFEPGG